MLGAFRLSPFKKVFHSVPAQSKRSFYTMSAKDLVINSKEGRHTGTVIFLHGLVSTSICVLLR